MRYSKIKVIIDRNMGILSKVVWVNRIFLLPWEFLTEHTTSLNKPPPECVKIDKFAILFLDQDYLFL